MAKTIQMKTTVVNSSTGIKTQELGYPITTPDRVIDSNGISIETALNNKININQGTENVGKILMVGEDGNVTLGSLMSARGVNF